MLAVSNFSKSYQNVLILTVDSLVLKPGVHLVKGDNGSGKTTLFKCLAGILPCDGKIQIDQKDLKKDPIAYRYSVNYAEAEPLYPGFLTAKDLIRFVGRIKKSTRQQQERYTEWLGVNQFFEKTCDTSSSGMLKKLSLVLAFLGQPKMIILDEPLITLDDQTRSALFQLMTQEKDIIFLLSSHQGIESRSLEINSTSRIEKKTLISE